MARGKAMKSSKILTQRQSDLSIVIPALHEEKRIGKTLDELARFLKNDSFFKSKTVEVLVVAANTTDQTHQIIKEKQPLFKDLTLLKPGRIVGKGRDVKYGVECANGSIIVFMDADLATPLGNLETFYNECRPGVDIVIGTRDLLTYRSNKLRSLYSSFGNFMYRLAGGIKVEDTQCGFKMFTAPAAKICFSKLTILGWGFDLEILAIAQANKLKIKAIRIDDYKHMPYSTHTDGVFRIAIRSISDLIRITIKRLSRTYI